MKNYHVRAPRIPLSELEASAVKLGEYHVLLHKRRCSEAALSGEATVPWCRQCASQLSQKPPRMPAFAIANHNWLGRLTEVQLKLLDQKYLGHRLLLSLARAVTSKVVYRPDGAGSGRSMWLDAYQHKGLKGTGIVFDNARRTQSESFPRASLGGSFIALFVGSDAAVDYGVFGKIDAKEFAADAALLREVNDVYAQAYLNEKELNSWPKDGSPPTSLEECCISLPTSETEHSEVPGTVGPAQMTSHGEIADAQVVPPWTSAIDDAAEDETSAPVLWGTLQAKLEEAENLGSRIKLREVEARVTAESSAVDQVTRDVLLNTCGHLQKCFQKLTTQVQNEKFQELCARVVMDSTTAAADVGQADPSVTTEADAGLSASRQGGVMSTSRLVVPTGSKPLDLFDYRVWTKMDPVCFWYNDCVWGHPQRPQPVALGEFHDMCMRREEHEYSTAEEIAKNQIYKAPSVNRFRTNYKILHMMQTTWGLEQKIRSVYAFTHRPGNRRALASFAKLTPQMLSDCFRVVMEHKNIGAVMRDKENVPSAVRRALDCMQLATQDVLNTDGHRRLLRHEGNAYAGRFGACAIFTTPNFPQQRHATFLLTRTECEDPDFSLEVEHPDLGILGDMLKKQADDPVGLALADDLVFRLFQMHVFGVREDFVGLRRGQAYNRLNEAVCDNRAAATTRIGIAGPPLAGHGPLASSGRFCLAWTLAVVAWQSRVRSVSRTVPAAAQGIGGSSESSHC